MSKLFKLKEWLTIDETAKHLSTALGEEVTVADIYRLALDGHLLLSMSFPNKAYGNLGVAVGIEQARRIPFNSDFSKSMRQEPPEEGTPSYMIVADRIGEDTYINWEEEVISVDGVWDLTMLASESIDVEYLYQQLTGGPTVELTCIDGTFLRRGDKFLRLAESWDENPYQKGSKAAEEAIKDSILHKNISPEDEAKIWENYKKSRKEFLEQQKTIPFKDQFYPAGQLPLDGVYVVRSSAILEFLTRVNGPQDQEKSLSTTERNSLLRLIAALCKQSNFNINDRGITSALVAATEDIGEPVSDDTIRKIIKQVKTLLG